MERLAQLAEMQLVAERLVATKEKELREAKEALAEIAERQLPELMDDLGLGTFRTTTGLTIKVRETIRASLTREKAAEGLAWLRDNGHATLIKEAVTVEPGEKIAPLVNYLTAVAIPWREESKVHPSTLSAWAREMLEAGHEFPLELFSVFRQRATKVDLAD